jgi:hypothetical protein
MFHRMMLLGIVLSSFPLLVHTQRLRGPDVWSSERYAHENNDYPTTWDGAKSEWEVLPQAVMWDTTFDSNGDRVIGPPPNLPNYSLNFERVHFLTLGRYYGPQDTTFNSASNNPSYTPIPSIFLFQDNRRVNDESTLRSFQVFSVESRGYRVIDPSLKNVESGRTYREANLEGLGVVSSGGVSDVSKYNVMVDYGYTLHPTILRYSDNNLDMLSVKGVASGDFLSDVRDEVVVFYDDGTQGQLYLLANTASMTAGNPLDYRLTRTTAATVAYATLDIRDIRFVISGNFDGTGQKEIVVLTKNASTTTQSIYQVNYTQPSGPWVSASKMAPATSTLDFDNILYATVADIEGDGNDEIVVLLDSNNHVVLKTIEASGGTWTINTPRLVFTSADVKVGTVFGLTAGNTDNSGATEILVLAQRQPSAAITATHLLSAKLNASTWQYQTVVSINPSALKADRVKFTFSGNLDYDVKHRDDYGIMYLSDASSEPEDRLMVWRSLPLHTENDFAVDTVSASSQWGSFFPHGWFGMRFVTGLTTGGIPMDHLEYRDDWGNVTWIQDVAGINYTPSIGRLDDAQFDEYASIYNAAVAERRHYTDGWRYASVGSPVDDAASTLYYYNNVETTNALFAYLGQASNRNIRVLPYLSWREHDNYNLDATTPLVPRDYVPFSFTTTEASATTNTMQLPEHFRRLLDPVSNIVNHRMFLGWYGIDEPSEPISPAWHTLFNPPTTPWTPALVANELRAFYRSIQHRTPNRPMYMNFNKAHDYEFFRNSLDVAMFDYYPITYDMTRSMDTATGISGAFPFVSSRIILNTQNTTNEALEYSFNKHVRNMFNMVLRCDKQAGIVIAQGRGDDYVERDVYSTDTNAIDTLLRTYPAMRNMSHDEARYQLFMPSIVGTRGVFFWEATSWMRATSNDSLFTDFNTDVNPVTNERIHYAAANVDNSPAQRAVIDNASSEFMHYRNIFLKEALMGRVSTSEIIPPKTLYDARIITSLHYDTTAGTYWLFVANTSSRSFEVDSVTLTVSGISGGSGVYPVPPEFWSTNRVRSIVPTYSDGNVVFSVPLKPFDVRVYAIGTRPDITPGDPLPADGHLSWSNQRKMIVWPHAIPDTNGEHDDIEDSDSIIYHSVYHRADCDTCPEPLKGWRVYYRKSHPMLRDDGMDNIDWRDEEHCVSCQIQDPEFGLAANGTCGYPSIVVRHDMDSNKAKVYIVYACEFAGGHPIEIENGAYFSTAGNIRIVENVFHANDSIPDVQRGRVYATAVGSSIHTIGFPVVGAIASGNFYAHSVGNDLGIEVGWKGYNGGLFNEVAINIGTYGGTYDEFDDHPSLWSYSRLHQDEEELPLVWHVDHDGRWEIAYTRLRRNGGVTDYYVPPTNTYPLYDNNKVYLVGRECGESVLPCVLRAAGQPANVRHDYIFWQNNRPNGDSLWCTPPWHLNSSMIWAQVLATVDIDANPTNDGVPVQAKHGIIHKYNSLYNPNVTIGRPMAYDKVGSDRTTLSFIGNQTLFAPLAHDLIQKRDSEIWWQKQAYDVTMPSIPHVNVYWNQFDSVPYPESILSDFEGDMPAQSAYRRYVQMGDYLGNRLLSEYGITLTPSVGVSRRAYYSPQGTTDNENGQSTTFRGLQSQSGFSGLERITVNGSSIPSGYLRNGEETSMASDWFEMKGLTMITVGAQTTSDDVVTYKLVSSDGVETTLSNLSASTGAAGTLHCITTMSKGGRYRIIGKMKSSSVQPIEITILSSTIRGYDGEEPNDSNGDGGDNPVRFGVEKGTRFAKTQATPGQQHSFLDLVGETSGELLVTPNPAKDQVQILLSPSSMKLVYGDGTREVPMNVTVHTAQGVRMIVPSNLEKGYVVLYVDDLPSGTYFVNLTVGTWSERTSVVVMR